MYPIKRYFQQSRIISTRNKHWAFSYDRMLHIRSIFNLPVYFAIHRWFSIRRGKSILRHGPVRHAFHAFDRIHNRTSRTLFNYLDNIRDRNDCDDLWRKTPSTKPGESERRIVSSWTHKALLSHKTLLSSRAGQMTYL